MIKKVILEKSDRLYHFPFDIEDFLPQKTLVRNPKRLPIIDLAKFRWITEGTGERIGSRGRLAGRDDIADFRIILSKWLKNEFGVKVFPGKEIYVGQGIRRMVFDACLAFVDHGDMVLCPEPGISFYRKMVIAAGGVPVTYPVSKNTDYKPSLKIISSNLGKAAKILFVNNPHNPTGVMLDRTDLSDLVRMASKMNIFIVNDAAYCSMAEEKYVSLLAVPGGLKTGLELFSIPFTFGLPYIPFGFAVGQPEIIRGLEISGKTIGNIIPLAWIERAAEAIGQYPSKELKDARKAVAETRHEAAGLVEKYGWEIVGGKSCPFLWIKIPGRRLAVTLAQTLLRRKGILVLPGNAFGESGDGHFRLSLTSSVEDYRQARQRLESGVTILSRKRDR